MPANPESYSALRRQLLAAMSALQIAARDAVGEDELLQLEKIAEWIKRAEEQAVEQGPSLNVQ